MSNIYLTPILINFDYLAAYSPMPINYNWEDIRPFVKVAESIWIAPILGEKLYTKLLKEVKENKITEEDSTLLLHIYELEAITVIFESLPFLTYSINEKGITKQSSDNTSTIDSKEFSEIKNNLRTKIEVLKENLKDFLEKNQKCYPDYVSVGKNKPNPDFRIYGSNKKY